MKNLLKHLGIVALIAVIGFFLTTCDDSKKDDDKTNDDTLPQAGNGFIDFSNDQIFPVEGAGDKIISFNIIENWSERELLTEAIPNSHANLNNGRLSLKLGKPNEELFVDASEYLILGEFFTETSVSATTSLKLFDIQAFYNGLSKNEFGDGDCLSWISEIIDTPTEIFYEEVHLTYANIDGNISGIIEDDFLNIKVNMNLKQGWNIVIYKLESDNQQDTTYTLVTGTPGSNIKWRFNYLE